MLIEAVATGYDTVGVSVSYTLAEGVDIEQLEPVTFNSTEALDLKGNEFGSLIIGNNGNNRIDGGGGADVLEGLLGADTFVFSTALGGANVDRISDFAVGVDKIELSSGIFTGLGAGALPASAFVQGTQAADGDDRIIYDTSTGNLWFDADGSGSGAAVQFARVASGLNISASDFVVSGSSASASATALENSFVALPGGEAAGQSFMEDDFGGLSPATLPTFGGGNDPHWMLTLLPADGSAEAAWFSNTPPSFDPWG